MRSSSGTITACRETRSTWTSPCCIPEGIIASDAMPWISKENGQIMTGKEWPLPDDAFAHPRTAATFVKFLIDYVRDRKAESLSDANRAMFVPSRKNPGNERPANEKEGTNPTRNGRRHHRLRYGQTPGACDLHRP